MIDVDLFLDKYNKRFEKEGSFEATVRIIDGMESDGEKEEEATAFRYILCQEIVTTICFGFLDYDRKDSEELNAIRDLLLGQADKLPKEDSRFLLAYAYFLKGNRTKCLKLLDRMIASENDIASFDVISFCDVFFVPFKDAFDGFWDHIYERLQKKGATVQVLDFCRMTDAFYDGKDKKNRLDLVADYYGEHQEQTFLNELLGYLYYVNGMWGNAVACFERVEENNFFPEADICFYKGWCYSKTGERINAIKSYERSVELNPKGAFARNNLAYEFYRLKHYNKALQLFQECMDIGVDVKLAANNYVRTLLAMKRFKDAKSFLKKAPAKIYASLAKRVKDSSYTNKRIKRDPVLELDDEGACNDKNELEEVQEILGIDSSANMIRESQFSSEKLLEDELSLRMDTGIPVFGKQLKIYRRHGEYGRQYIIPIGRLDLLAEDQEGNLYIIELKKDSGYDDPYEQTAAYLDWFEKNRMEKGQNIYGIICLNNPEDDLIDKVRKDDRMSLFHYSISYDEIK